MKYFNLNERARKAWENNNGTSLVVQGIPELFSKEGNHLFWNATTLERIEECLDKVPFLHQLLMYLGTFIGVLLSTAVTHFRSGNIDLSITLSEVVVSAVVALVIIPLVYEKLNLNPKAPFIVQFGIFVQNGVFWHVLIDSIGNLV